MPEQEVDEMMSKSSRGKIWHQLHNTHLNCNNSSAKVCVQSGWNVVMVTGDLPINLFD